MTATTFFAVPDSLALSEVAAMTGAELRDGSGEARIARVRALASAGPADVTFFENRRYRSHLKLTRAAACFIHQRDVAQLPRGVAALIAPQPYRAFVHLAQYLYPGSAKPGALFGAAGVSPAAHVHPDARLEADVVVEPGAVIGPDCEIGEGTLIGATAVIGAGVRIGRHSNIGAGATVMHALVGDHVVIHPGCRIGQDGFAYTSDRTGHTKIPQLGRVIIQDRVEIGAQTTIDRGGLQDTVIGEGTRIDNLVQIAHNCTIGRHCLIVSQCGISGSVTLGDFAILAGAVGVADHVTIGAGARVGAGSGVLADVAPGETVLGYPAMPGREFLRAIVFARNGARAAGDKEK